MIIKDNSYNIDKAKFSEIPNLTKKILNKTLKDLEEEGVFVFPEAVKEAEDIEDEQTILKGKGGSYRTGNVVGFLGLGDERLTIQSRFSGDNDFFFLYLLERVMEFPSIASLQTDTNRDNRLFNFWLFIFPYYLKRALRKGLFKTYIRRNYNDANVKGAIDVARHIKQNTPFVGKIAYSTREFSYDNSLIELVRHTIEFIRGQKHGRNILAKVKDDVRQIVEATPKYQIRDRRKIITQNRKSPVRHAYFREYRDLQRLCLLILLHPKHQLGTGSDRICGVLFDCAWLWEEYVCTLIGDKFHHPRNKAKNTKDKGTQWLFNDENGNANGKIYPDFISKDSVTRIIADAKYKPRDKICDGNRDYFQLLAYMFRFDAKTGYFLYPESETVNDLKLRLNRGSTFENNVKPRDDISVTKHGLKIPVEAENYDEFVAKIKESEQEFIKAFR